MTHFATHGAANDAARSRYNSAFHSKIFEPQESPNGERFVPAGRRRDQTTQELFGSYEDKELHAMPKTFLPKDDILTARQKKMNFLSSDVLPATHYPSGTIPRGPPQPRCNEGLLAAEDEMPNPKMRRQQDLATELFDRESPQVSSEHLYRESKQLVPNDFKWFSIPETSKGYGLGQKANHHDRYYHEKCSNLFDRQSPQAGEHVDHHAQRVVRQEEDEGEQKRRANVYYSDLFGRHTPMDLPPNASDGHERFHPKLQGPEEDKIVVHQDWTDSKTELISRRSDKEMPASARKQGELHQARVFGGRCEYEPPMQGDLEPVTTDNSIKVKAAIGHSTQHIHQAHLRTSMTSEQFYEEAQNTKHWEVVELHVSGLPMDANEKMVRDLCGGCDLQIVKVAVEMDPVRNLCKGRAKIMVRYNPKRDSIHSLVERLEDCKLRVEL